MADEQRTLAVNLTANASGFTSGTNEAIRKLKELNTQAAANKQAMKQTNNTIFALLGRNSSGFAFTEWPNLGRSAGLVE